MVRNPLKKEEPTPPAPPQEQPQSEAPQVQVVEREINLTLINDKLNYITGIVHKIAEACEVDLSK